MWVTFYDISVGERTKLNEKLWTQSGCRPCNFRSQEHLVVSSSFWQRAQSIATMNTNGSVAKCDSETGNHFRLRTYFAWIYNLHTFFLSIIITREIYGRTETFLYAANPWTFLFGELQAVSSCTFYISLISHLNIPCLRVLYKITR